MLKDLLNNLKLEEHGPNEQFREDCVERCVNELLETQTYMRNYIGKKLS